MNFDNVKKNSHDAIPGSSPKYESKPLYFGFTRSSMLLSNSPRSSLAYEKICIYIYIQYDKKLGKLEFGKKVVSKGHLPYQKIH